MRHGLLFLLVVASCFGASQQLPCNPVTGSRILGSDLARAIPAFDALPKDLPLGASPVPGGTRLFRAADLDTLAEKNGISGIRFTGDVCFRLETGKPDREVVLATLRQVLRIPDAQIEITDISSDPVPAGQIEFLLENLVSPSRKDTPVPTLWTGSVVTDGGRRYPIWVRVRIFAPIRQFVAVEDLKPGTTIRDGQIRVEDTEGFPSPSASSPLPPLETMIGMMPLRVIKTGTPVRPESLTQPADVNRGDTVRVEVRLGSLRIGLTGTAESGGRSGDSISVRNPVSGRTFAARVESRGTVIVEPGRWN